MNIAVTKLKLKRKSRQLEVHFNTGEQASLSCELLRVCSPSAEVHGHGNPVLVTNKREVNINEIKPVGGYAVKLVFDDGHDSGLYSWELLHQYAQNQQELWQDYLERLAAAKGSREPLLDIKVDYSNKG
ncbi:gamma-butyrobetaine hydroxylase-like domain-containing protein [Ferrimonas aestuarii]|uniref:DUF971 domain-containing protein n=1 Tax=Ferrimonas aestuarii TaxID=2569539 RepID=A0A4U1BRY6_9GAMM|nr:DUF971 domain-containing protein [Ferrimonas aestuarii]TKB56082.1 DUF971 domain-containing protein [Ferrimonas aestuarii]